MGASAIYQLATPWGSDDLATLGYEQTADVIRFTHLNYNPYKLTRYGHAIWLLEAIAFGTTTGAPTGVAAAATTPNTTGIVYETYSYVVTAVDDVTGRESLQSTAATVSNDLSLDGNFNTVTWSAVTGAGIYNVYKEVAGIYGYIGSSAALTFKDQNIGADLSDTPPQNREPFSGTYDKPAVVTFYQQRCVFGRTKNKPNAGFASQSADFDNMNVARPAKANDAITFGLVAQKVNTIMHFLPMKSLLALTDTAVFAITGTDGYITPTATVINVEGYRGSSRVRPVLVDDMAFFNTAKGSAIRTIGYQFDRDGYRGNDITVFAPHLFTKRKLVSMSWSEYPASTLWVVRDDGRALALTWQAEQDVWGWSVMETDGVIEDVCTITEAGEDVSYFIVKRFVDGRDRRFMERLASPNWADIAHANYLDCSRTYEGEPEDTFLVPHLAGRTVTALADGAVYEGLPCTGGVVTLPNAHSVVTIGLPYEAWIYTLPPAHGGQVKGRTRLTGEATISVVDTRGIEVAPGRKIKATDEVTSTQAGREFFECKTRNGEPYGSVPDLFTGDLSVNLAASDWTESGLVIRQRFPLPMMITGVAQDEEIGG